MEPVQRRQVLDDLKGIVKGELLFDDLSCAIYSTDASIFQVDPAGIVVPRDEEDLSALVSYAAEHQIPLVPRGAGTGLAGEALGTGLIVDLSRHFRGILDIGPDTVRVQPGVVYDQLNERLRPLGRRFAPDPTSGVQCTIGGMLATNASGARTLRYGYTRDHIESLRIVLGDGSASAVGLEPRTPANGEPTRLKTIVGQVVNLLTRNAQILQTCRTKTRFDRCGYLLHDVLTPEALDLRKLLIGSEGTLAFFTEATLRTIPIPLGRSLVVLGFDSLDAAMTASQQAQESGPVACELIDRRLVTMARGRSTEAKPLVPSEAEAVLFLEYEADSPDGARDIARRVLEQQTRGTPRPLFAVMAVAADEIERLWQLRQTALPSLYGLREGPQPVAFVEDVGVPLDVLADYVHQVQAIFKRHEITASFLIHAGTGQVHVRPFLDLQVENDRGRLWGLAQEIHGLAIELGGTVTSQHGTGLARTPWVEAQVKQLYPIFRELKSIFDPLNLLNPGKIIGPDPSLPAWPLRRVPAKPTEAVQHVLRWEPDEIRAESLSCNGCGHCRTESAGERMCPTFRATHAEAASPRAKANLLRYLLEEGRDPKALASDEVRAVADYCVNCRLCQEECPAHVNVCKLMLELKAANVMQYGLNRFEWTMASTENFATLASRFALVVNFALASRPFRWVLERLLGVSRKRLLPRFARRPFMNRAAHQGWTHPPYRDRPRVAYFVDVFANYNDPSIAEAVVAVLHHNDIEVYVPPDQKGCGMAPLAAGDVESAREVAEHNLRILSEVARQGYVIICSEPTAALMLKQDYPDLVDDPDARMLALHVEELTSFLWDLHQQGRLRTDFQPLPFSVGHHVPCHLKALGRPPAGPDLLRLIPDLRVNTLDISCSGMAGTFGLLARNYALSLEAGRPMLDLLRHPQNLFGSTECSTCRMQMEDGAGKRTLHPVQYLALAYGLLPEISERLQAPLGKLVLQ